MNTIKIFPLNDLELGFLFFQKREKKGVSLRYVASQIKCSVNLLSKFENGNGLMSMGKIIRYAELLELDLKFCVQS